VREGGVSKSKVTRLGRRGRGSRKIKRKDRRKNAKKGMRRTGEVGAGSESRNRRRSGVGRSRLRVRSGVGSRRGSDVVLALVDVDGRVSTAGLVLSVVAREGAGLGVEGDVAGEGVGAPCE
jgi:hypothetical protein